MIWIGKPAPAIKCYLRVERRYVGTKLCHGGWGSRGKDDRKQNTLVLLKPYFPTVERLLLQEGNPMPLVFQNIYPPPPSPPGESVPFVEGEDPLAKERGWGVNILEDESHRIALLQ
jgi:hypothetical protein